MRRRSGVDSRGRKRGALDGSAGSQSSNLALVPPLYVISGWEIGIGGHLAALAGIRKPLTKAAVSGGRGWDAEIHRMRGELTGRLPYPDPPKAEDSFRTALAIAREQGTRGYQLRAATSLARLWREQGRRAQARDLLAPVYASFTGGVDTQDLKDAKALLDELA